MNNSNISISSILSGNLLSFRTLLYSTHANRMFLFLAKHEYLSHGDSRSGIQGVGYFIVMIEYVFIIFYSILFC